MSGLPIDVAVPDTHIEPERWSAYMDGDERVPIFDTEGEAIGAIECQIDSDHEPGTEVEYCVAPMVSGKHLLRKQSAQWIGDEVFERVNERLDDDMGAEENPLDMTEADRRALGQVVIDFICQHAKTQWWTVDAKREQKRTYVAGSSDQPNTEGQRP